tara:strand:- start:335 stop:565 length:231 start_codon:yes stop_codon:yes gene_type:complete
MTSQSDRILQGQHSNRVVVIVVKTTGSKHGYWQSLQRREISEYAWFHTTHAYVLPPVAQGTELFCNKNRACLEKEF